MATKWNYGVNLAVNGNGDVPFTGWAFVNTISGNDSNSFTPTSSGKTIAAAMVIPGVTKIVVHGNIEEDNLNIPVGIEIIGNQNFSIESTGPFNVGNNFILRNLKAEGKVISQTNGGIYHDCLFNNCQSTGRNDFTKCTVVGGSYNYTSASNIEKTTFNNVTNTNDADVNIINTDLDQSTSFIVNSGTTSISYSNNRMATQTGITDGGNNINADPVYILKSGVPYAIQRTSLLFGKGTNNTTIGALRDGVIEDITITVSTGQVLTQTISKINTQPRVLPTVHLIGDVDASTDAIPQANVLISVPKPYTFFMKRKQEGQSVFEVDKRYMYRFIPLQDDEGDSNGSIRGIGAGQYLDASGEIVDNSIEEEIGVTLSRGIETLSQTIFWYKSDYVETNASGITKILNLTNKNPSNADLQTNSINLASLVNNDVNGNPGIKIRPDGIASNQYVSAGSIESTPIAQPFTKIIAFKFNALGTGDQALFGNFFGDSHNISFTSATARLLLVAPNALFSVSSLVVGQSYVVTGIFNGANSKIRINKVLDVTGNAGSGTIQNLSIGGIQAVANNSMQVSVTDFGVLAGDLQVDNLTLLEDIEQSLMDKIGI